MAIELSEHEVQRLAVQALRETRVKFFAVPNGGLRSKGTALKLWAEGVQAGVPDLIIIDPPPAKSAVGTVLEFKRRKGGVVSEAQKGWLAAFAERGWEARVVCGLAEFHATMQELGYLKPQSSAAAGSTAPSPTVAAPEQSVPAPCVPIHLAPARPTRGKGAAA